ncbi:MAG TPA: hypothetical protein VGB07_15510 [Blastocatellia bacterium]
MFCPHCGSARQRVHAYCRTCGSYLFPNKGIQWEESPAANAGWLLLFSLLTLGLSLFGAVTSRLTFGILLSIALLHCAGAATAFDLRRRFLRRQSPSKERSDLQPLQNESLENKPTETLEATTTVSRTTNRLTVGSE